MLRGYKGFLIMLFEVEDWVHKLRLFSGFPFVLSGVPMYM